MPIATLNETFVIGTVADEPAMSLGSGTPCATTRLCVEEPGTPGARQETGYDAQRSLPKAGPYSGMGGRDDAMRQVPGDQGRPSRMARWSRGLWRAAERPSSLWRYTTRETHPHCGRR